MAFKDRKLGQKISGTTHLGFFHSTQRVKGVERQKKGQVQGSQSPTQQEGKANGRLGQMLSHTDSISELQIIGKKFRQILSSYLVLCNERLCVI